MGIERRQYQRVQIPRIRIALRDGDQTAQYLHDISRGGVAFQMARCPPVGMHLALNLIIPGESEPLELAGEVVRIASGMVALRFDPLDGATESRLNALLARHGAPAPQRQFG